MNVNYFPCKLNIKDDQGKNLEITLLEQLSKE